MARLRPAVGGPARLAGLVTAVVLLVGACSATGALSTADTSTNVTAAVPPASADAGPSMTGGGASASSSQRASTAKIQVSVADGATGVSVLDPVTVRVTGGELGQARAWGDSMALNLTWLSMATRAGGELPSA